MSHDNPGAADRPSGEVEYLDETAPRRGAEAGPGGRSGRRWALIAGGTAAVLGVGAAGAFGVASFLGGGTAPAAAVPSDALGYLALDLDPGGGQKLEAYRTLKKFPALKDQLGLTSSDGDLRKTLVEKLLEDGCPDVDFDSDINPWLGSKVAVGVVPNAGKTPTPFGVLQVKDQDKAQAGLKTLASCDSGGQDGSSGSDAGDYGTAYLDNYVVIAETDDQAAAIADDAQNSSLAEDADYQKWVKQAGGDGIVTGYAAKEAPGAYLDAMQGMLGGGAFPTDSATATVATPALSTGRLADTPDGTAQLEETFKDFQGAAMAVRFHNGALEIESAAGGLPDQANLPEGDSGLQSLPATTALAFGFAVSDTFVQDTVDSYAKTLGQDRMDQLLQEGESQTGLSLPEDLQTLLGDQVTVALDGSASLSEQGISRPQDLPVSIRIRGDVDKIVAVLDKVLAAAGVPRDQVIVEQGDGVVAVGLNAEQTKALTVDGSLGDQDRFKEALPELSRSSGGFYVDLDSDGWLSALIDQAGDDSGKLRANLEPLGALGISGWTDGDVSHGLMRLTTD